MMSITDASRASTPYSGTLNHPAPHEFAKAQPFAFWMTCSLRWRTPWIFRAALRRQSRSRHTEPYRLGDLTVDHVARSVTVSGRAARLTPTEYKVLHELCADAGRVLTYDHLLERVWGEGSAGDPRRVRTLVKDLRRKLGDDARSSTMFPTYPRCL